MSTKSITAGTWMSLSVAVLPSITLSKGLMERVQSEGQKRQMEAASTISL